jgi:DnaJ-like protein
MRFHRLIYGLAIVTCMILIAGSAQAQGGELVRAEWGVPGNRVDVTSRVRTFIHDGVLQLEVTRFNLGIDPAPHQNKDLVIRVRRWDGKVEEYKYPERSTCTLELVPPDRREAREHHDWDGDHDRDRDRDYDRHEHGLRILRADYGVEGQFVDVTDTLRSRVGDGRLSVRVDNYTLGVDPAPGVHKYLRVDYVFRGERRNVMVDEKTFLQLP